MTATQLLTDLAQAGICIKAHGDRLLYSPRSAMTPALLARLKAHKNGLLAILRGDPDPEADDMSTWEECLSPPKPCPECNGLELWESMAGTWRCLRCDPPTKSRAVAEKAARLRSRIW